MSGRNPSEIIDYIEQGLESTVLTSSTDKEGDRFQVVLKESVDDNDLGLGGFDAQDGAFMIRYLGGSSFGSRAAGPCGANVTGDVPPVGVSAIVLQFQHNFSLEFTYAVAGASGFRMRIAKYEIAEAAVNRLMYLLMPGGSGAKKIFKDVRVTIDRPRRMVATQSELLNTDAAGFYHQIINFTLASWWREDR